MSGGKWGIILGGWVWVGAGGALFLGGGWGWVGMSGVGEGDWAWVHCLIMSFSITLSGHDYFKEWQLF